MSLLIYGLVRAGHAAPPPGFAGAVRLVTSGPVAAAVRELPDDAELRDEDIAAYFDALVALMAGGPVLPVRFGTVAEDDRELCDELLDAHPDALTERLDAVDGLVEVWVHVEADADGQTRGLADAFPGLVRGWRARAGAAAIEDRIELGRELGERLAELRDELSDRLLERLGGLAVAHARVRSDEVTELRHAYLIRVEQLPAFDEAVQALRLELGASYAVEYVGPLPPFELTDAAPTDAQPARSRWSW